MASSLTEAEEKYRKYVLERLMLEDLTVEQLKAKYLEQRQMRGEDAAVPKAHWTKETYISMILPTVARPSGVLWYEKGPQSNQSNNSVNIPRDAPPSLTDDDLLNEKGKYVTVNNLKDLLRERGLPVSGNKDSLVRRLLAYTPETFVPVKPTNLDRFKYRPVQDGVLQRLWDMIDVHISHFHSQNFVAEAGELMDLRPHILQHMDSSFSYHIGAHKNYSQFRDYYRNGEQHWQGNHSLCYFEKECPREGVLQLPLVIPIVHDILQTSSDWITEQTHNIWHV